MDFFLKKKEKKRKKEKRDVAPARMAHAHSFDAKQAVSGRDDAATIFFPRGGRIRGENALTRAEHNDVVFFIHLYSLYARKFDAKSRPFRKLRILFSAGGPRARDSSSEQ